VAIAAARRRHNDNHRYSRGNAGINEPVIAHALGVLHTGRRTGGQIGLLRIRCHCRERRQGERSAQGKSSDVTLHKNIPSDKLNNENHREDFISRDTRCTLAKQPHKRLTFHNNYEKKEKKSLTPHDLGKDAQEL
jgi:hypothetical protein